MVGYITANSGIWTLVLDKEPKENALSVPLTTKRGIKKKKKNRKRELPFGFEKNLILTFLRKISCLFQKFSLPSFILRERSM